MGQHHEIVEPLTLLSWTSYEQAKMVLRILSFLQKYSQAPVSRKSQAQLRLEASKISKDTSLPYLSALLFITTRMKQNKDKDDIPNLCGRMPSLTMRAPNFSLR